MIACLYNIRILLLPGKQRCHAGIAEPITGRLPLRKVINVAPLSSVGESRLSGISNLIPDMDTVVRQQFSTRLLSDLITLSVHSGEAEKELFELIVEKPAPYSLRKERSPGTFLQRCRRKAR